MLPIMAGTISFGCIVCHKTNWNNLRASKEWLWSDKCHVISPSNIVAPYFVISIKDDHSKNWKPYPWKSGQMSSRNLMIRHEPQSPILNVYYKSYQLPTDLMYRIITFFTIGFTLQHQMMQNGEKRVKSSSVDVAQKMGVMQGGVFACYLYICGI